MRAGERVPIEAPPDSLTFMMSARTRTARAANRTTTRTFPVAPNPSGDRMLLGIPLATEPGNYSIDVSFANEASEERGTTLQVTVEPLATPAAGSTMPPVVLLDGWQAPGSTGACTMSSDSSGTFGKLESYLSGAPNFAPAVYFFENCTQCPGCSIEQLGADLGTFLNLIRYSDGTPVPQVDVVAHSMGGLIIRSYLSGKQESIGVFSPPPAPKIRKAVFIATPHFGSFQADSFLAEVVFGGGTQANQMKRGSQFLWDLATWNQFGDDLRGTDILAVIGNAGSFNSLPQASDGVVDLTSGSLDFARPGRTKIVTYCHIPISPGIEAGYLGCTGPGIANIDSPAHQTYQIVSSFLVDSGSWQSVGTAPAQDQYLSKYGGMMVASLSSSNQYVIPDGVSWGGVALTAGAVGYVYFNDMVSGTGSFAFGTSTCGPYTQPAGIYSAVRCKLSPTVYSVGPLLSGAQKIVQAGTTIAITGAGFGPQQCGVCQVTAANPQSTMLQISSWSDTSIKAFLPASFAGIYRIGVTTANGLDAINIVVVQLTTKNSASYGAVPLAPDAIAFSEAPGIAPSLTVATGSSWPTMLGGVSLEITDSQGTKQLAPIYYVTTNAISYLIPSVTAVGPASVKLTTSTGATIPGVLNIDRISPGLFTANASGSGVPAGFWIRAAADGSQTQDYLFDPAKPVGSRVATPVDLGAATDQVFLSLYGTGFRGATQPTAIVGGVTVPAAFAAVASYQGEDLVNIGPLPRSLVGSGEVNVSVIFDGRSTNTVSVNIR